MPFHRASMAPAPAGSLPTPGNLLLVPSSGPNGGTPPRSYIRSMLSELTAVKGRTVNGPGRPPGHHVG